jgi:hypothetical protein
MHHSGAWRREEIELCLSLRGATGSRESAPDDRLRDEAIQVRFQGKILGLLRFARNHGAVLDRVCFVAMIIPTATSDRVPASGRPR